MGTQYIRASQGMANFKLSLKLLTETAEADAPPLNIAPNPVKAWVEGCHSRQTHARNDWEDVGPPAEDLKNA